MSFRKLFVLVVVGAFLVLGSGCGSNPNLGSSTTSTTTTTTNSVVFNFNASPGQPMSGALQTSEVSFGFAAQFMGVPLLANPGPNFNYYYGAGAGKHVGGCSIWGMFVSTSATPGKYEDSIGIFCSDDLLSWYPKGSAIRLKNFPNTKLALIADPSYLRLVLPNGPLVYLYTTATTNREGEHSNGIYLSLSSDGGATFSEPVLVISGPDKGWGYGMPVVFYRPDLANAFQMWFVDASGLYDNPAPQTACGTQCYRHATSQDGVHWLIDINPSQFLPLAWIDKPLNRYIGIQWSAGTGGRAYLYTSTDGLSPEANVQPGEIAQDGYPGISAEGWYGNWRIARDDNGWFPLDTAMPIFYTLAPSKEADPALHNLNLAQVNLTISSAPVPSGHAVIMRGEQTPQYSVTRALENGMAQNRTLAYWSQWAKQQSNEPPQ